MNFQKMNVQKVAWLVGGVLALLSPFTPMAYAKTESVTIIERTPDESNPQYEKVVVEGGLTFRVPKGIPFVKKDGLIGPITDEEYFVDKIGGLTKQIEALSDRIAELEKNAAEASEKKIRVIA